jgi:hypothetical protein
MKKALGFALCVVGFILIAAPTAVERVPLFINGKPAGEAVLINGVIAISMENFARAGGATLTLQPSYQRLGTRLSTIVAKDVAKNDARGVPAVQAGMIKQGEAGALKQTPAGQIFRTQKAGEISGRVFDFEGKAYFPLADLARALGNNTATGIVFKANEPLRLNGSSNPNAILIGL